MMMDAYRIPMMYPRPSTAADVLMANTPRSLSVKKAMPFTAAVVKVSVQAW